MSTLGTHSFSFSPFAFLESEKSKRRKGKKKKVTTNVDGAHRVIQYVILRN